MLIKIIVLFFVVFFNASASGKGDTNTSDDVLLDSIYGIQKKGDVVESEANKEIKKKYKTTEKLNKKTLSKMGKGKKLSDKEINLALLTFAKEQERKKKLLIEKKKKEKEKERLFSSKNKTSPVSGHLPQKISFEEQKRRIRSGLTQFPTSTTNRGRGGSSRSKSNQGRGKKSKNQKKFKEILFYGISCIGGTCVGLAEDGTYSVGQVFDGGRGEEKITAIKRNLIVTNMRTFDLANNSQSKGKDGKNAKKTKQKKDRR